MGKKRLNLKVRFGKIRTLQTVKNPIKKAEISRFISRRRQHSILLITGTILIPTMLVGCDPLTKELKAVEYATLTGDEWKVSIPAEQGLDMMFATEVGYNVANLETIYGLLVIKNSNLIAERYFNKGSVEQKA